MDTSTWIWIVVAIVVVLVIIGVSTALGRKRRRVLAEKQAHDDREEAGRLRAHAKDVDLDAREKHAAAARTAADAEQAAVEAERLRMQAEQQRAAAAEDAAKSKATYREAAAVDPDIDTAEHAGHSPERRNARVTSDGPVAEPVQVAGTEREDGPVPGDEAQPSQENRHGRGKEDL